MLRHHYLVTLAVYRGQNPTPRRFVDRLVDSTGPLSAMRRAEDLENLCVQDNEYAAAKTLQPVFGSVLDGLPVAA